MMHSSEKTPGCLEGKLGYFPQPQITSINTHLSLWFNIERQSKIWIISLASNHFILKYWPEMTVNWDNSLEGVFPNKVTAKDNSPQYQKVVDVTDEESKPRFWLLLHYFWSRIFALLSFLMHSKFWIIFLKK